MKYLLLITLLLGQLQNQTGVVTGRLTKEGKPASGIRVTAMAIPEPGVRVADVAAFFGVVQTDSDGRYRLENIPPGKYYVTAGFLDIPTYYPGVAAITGATAVNVEAGATTTGIDFTTAAPSGLTVSGRVIFPPGQAMPANRQASLAGLQTTLKEDGSFEFFRVRPGTHSLRIPAAAPVQNTTIVTADANVTGLEIVVPYSVAGKVVVENGGPLPKLSLSFGSGTREIPLLPAGAFNVYLTEGEYRFAVSNLPPGYSVKSMTAGSADILANPLKLTAGSPPAPVLVTLGVASPPPWVSVSGKVAGPGFVPSPTPYRLALTGAALLDPLTFGLAPDGTFELPQVLPGDYTLSVTAPVLPVPAVSLKVENNDVRGIQISVPAMKTVTGRTRVDRPGQASQPFSIESSRNASVAYTLTTGGLTTVSTGTSSSGSLNFQFTDASGTAKSSATHQAAELFQVTLPEGERRVVVDVPGYTVRSLLYGTVDLLKDPVLKVTDADTAEFDVTLEPSMTSAGFILNSPNGSVRISAGADMFVVRSAVTTLSSMVAGLLATPSTLQTVYIGSDVAKANQLNAVPPAYPPQARAAGPQDVTLRVFIDKEGRVTKVGVITGHPLLNEAAIEAVKQWRYRPYSLNNGQPSDVVTTVTVSFLP
jgi:TonB family protein